MNTGPQGWRCRCKCHSGLGQLTSGRGQSGQSPHLRSSLLTVFPKKPGRPVPAQIPTTSNCPRRRRLPDPQEGLSPLGATRATRSDKCHQGPSTTLAAANNDGRPDCGIREQPSSVRLICSNNARARRSPVRSASTSGRRCGASIIC